MSIALPAFVITLLVLPGILASFYYRKGPGRSPLRLGTIQDEIGLGLLWAIPINIVAFVLANALPFDNVNLESIFWVLTGYQETGPRLERHIESFTEYPLHILFYLLFVNAFGVLAGKGLHLAVRYYYLDIKYPFMRFQNEWHYLFSGEARFFDAESKEISRAAVRQGLDEIEFVFVTMVLEQGREVYLYRGVLSEYYFNKGGHLDKIIIEAPQRRLISNDDANGEFIGEERFYKIVGKFFAIKYNVVKNLNIYYYTFDRENDLDQNQYEAPYMPQFSYHPIIPTITVRRVGNG